MQPSKRNDDKSTVPAAHLPIRPKCHHPSQHMEHSIRNRISNIQRQLPKPLQEAVAYTYICVYIYMDIYIHIFIGFRNYSHVLHFKKYIVWTVTEPSLFFGSKHVCILRLYTTEYSHTICLRPWLHFRWIARLLAVLDQASHLAFADYICSCCMMSSEILMFSACSIASKWAQISSVVATD